MRLRRIRIPIADDAVALGSLRGVDLGAFHWPADGVVVEPAAAGPVLVHLREHRSHHSDG